MRRSWYSYLLVFAGSLAVLIATFRPMVGATSAMPGAVVLGPEQRLIIPAASPISRAGLQTNDRFVRAETVEVARLEGEALPLLRWKGSIPRAGTIEYVRSGKRGVAEISPIAPAPLVRLAWSLAGLLNLGLTLLALMLFWQRPRDGSAVLLGLVLLTAPVFAFPREPRLLAVALAAHFFSAFPAAALAPGAGGRLRRFFRAARLYLPFLVFGFVGAVLLDHGQARAAGALYDTLAVGYALFGLVQVVRKRRAASSAVQPVLGALTAAAGAILAAAVLASSQRIWLVGDQFVPANLPPAVIFGVAVVHLVFRLRALEVRLVARRTLQYLLARWTLGGLFLVPGFLLVFRVGQLSTGSERVRPGEAVPYLLWMTLAAVLLRKRQSVLRNLDRRFFRLAEARREGLIRLAQVVGEQRTEEAVWTALLTGIRQALQPERAWREAEGDLAPGAGEVAIPVRRGAETYGRLRLRFLPEEPPCTTEERGLLEAAAVQAGSALENARLSQELLARQRAELTARSIGVLAGAEEERRRLAADLHDQVLPELRQIAGEVERLRLAANGSGGELSRLEGEVRGTMDTVREVMEALRPSALDMLGLFDALESYLRKSAERARPPIAVSIRRTGSEPVLSSDHSLGLYRICQEAINNAVRHSQGHRIQLEVSAGPAAVEIVVLDDGIGLDPRGCSGQGRGLGNMQYRADLMGARVEWGPAAGGGTRMTVSLPLPEERALTPPHAEVGR
jgi:signal transduction histidine kinase